MPFRILVVDDEPYILPTLSALLGTTFEVITADSAEAAQQVFAARDVDLILTDQRMPRVTGIQLLEWVREHSPKTVRLLMTGYAELEDAVEAINRGQVYYYLLKPWRTEELLQTLRSAAHTFRLERDNVRLLTALVEICNEFFFDLYHAGPERLVEQVDRYTPFALQLARLLEARPGNLAASVALAEFFKFRGCVSRTQFAAIAHWACASVIRPSQTSCRS